MPSVHLCLICAISGFISNRWVNDREFFLQSVPYLTVLTFPSLSLACTFPFHALHAWTPGWLETSFCSCFCSRHKCSLNVITEPFRFFLSFITPHFTSQYLNFTTTGLFLLSVFWPNLWVRGINTSLCSFSKPNMIMLHLWAYWSFSAALAIADWMLSCSSWRAFSKDSTLFLSWWFSCLSQTLRNAVCQIQETDLTLYHVSFGTVFCPIPVPS